VTVADPAAEHDVTDGGKSGDLGHRSYRPNAERIALRVSQRMAATDRQHSDSGVHGVGRHDTEHLAAGPNLTQRSAGSAILRADYSHLAARLPDG
jgi:hypothetical protein